MSDDEDFVTLAPATPESPAPPCQSGGSTKGKKRAGKSKLSVLGSIRGKFEGALQRVSDTNNRRLKMATWKEQKDEFERRKFIEQLIPAYERAAKGGDRDAAGTLQKYRVELESIPKHKKVAGQTGGLAEHHERLLKADTLKSLVKQLFATLELVDDFITEADKSRDDLEVIQYRIEGARLLAGAAMEHYENLPEDRDE